MNYKYTLHEFPSEEAPGTSVFYETPTEGSSTLTPLAGVAASHSSAPI